MEHVFSVEGNLDHFWAPPPSPPLQPHMIAEGINGVGALNTGFGAMNSYTSEYYLQKFQETLLDDPTPPSTMNSSTSATILYPNPMTGASQRIGYGDEVVDMIPTPTPMPTRATSTVVDPVEYNAMLKQQLEMDLAAVAMWRAAGAMHPESSLCNGASSNLDGPNLILQNYTGGNGILLQNKLVDDPSGVSSPYIIQNADAHVKQATSPSSGDPSQSDEDDDDDMEGATYIMGNMGLTPEKIKKRKESNRESARRSRCRKAAHLKDLEEQVSHLRIENSSLLRRLAITSQKYNIATVDNRVLKANVETLKAKVKMAEETVKRVTCTNQLPQAISSMPSLNIPISGSPSDVISDASVPIQDNQITYFATTTNAIINNNHMPEIDPTFRIEDMIDGALTTTGPTSSMNQTTSQNVMDLQSLQRRVCGAPSSSRSMPWGSTPFGYK